MRFECFFSPGLRRLNGESCSRCCRRRSAALRRFGRLREKRMAGKTLAAAAAAAGVSERAARKWQSGPLRCRRRRRR